MGPAIRIHVEGIPPWIDQIGNGAVWLGSHWSCQRGTKLSKSFDGCHEFMALADEVEVNPSDSDVTALKPDTAMPTVLADDDPSIDVFALEFHEIERRRPERRGLIGLGDIDSY